MTSLSLRRMAAGKHTLVHVFVPVRARWFGLALTVLLAPAAYAHDPLPNSWCTNPAQSPAVVANFDFTPKMLELFRARNPELNIPQDPNCADRKSCGIVDEWHYANEMSLAFCAGSAESRQSPTAAMPFIAEPSDFNAKDHHDSYRFQDGNLVGACVVCVDRTDAPAPAPTPEDPTGL